MPINQARGSFSAEESLVDYSVHNGSQLYGASLLDSQYFPQAPERSTSSREAVQRGLTAWYQYGLMDDPFFAPNSTLAFLPTQRDFLQNNVEQSIDSLNMLMVDLEPHTPVPKSQSAPPGVNGTAFQPFTKTLPKPSYQADQNFASAQPLSTSASFGQTFQRTSTYATTPPGTFYQKHYQIPQSPSPTYQHDACSLKQDSLTTQSPTVSLPFPIKPQTINSVSGPLPCSSDLQASSPYPVNQNSHSATSSPMPPNTPVKEPEEENLNLEGLVAHRIAGNEYFVLTKTFFPARQTAVKYLTSIIKIIIHILVNLPGGQGKYILSNLAVTV